MSRTTLGAKQKKRYETTAHAERPKPMRNADRH